MIYQRLGRTNLEVSRLSFGAMRLPYKDGRPDPDESVRMIHRSFELGINLIDTAVFYCDQESEGIVGQALKGWRDKVYVSTKNHYRGPDEGAWRENLENSLERLDVDYIDIYNLHGINWKDWEKWGERIVGWMHKAKDEGLIRHVCCSFHDNAEALRKIAATEAFSSIILQYNLLYRELEPVFEEIANRDLGIIVMGPVGGGQLAEESEVLTELIRGEETPAGVALRYVLSNPYVTAAISGMSTMEQVEENCRNGGRTAPLTDAEKENVHAVLAKLKGLEELYCTGCRYCLPCPSGVDIPGIFKAVNKWKVYDLKETAKRHYGWIVGKARECIACGACEEKCPQNIAIRKQMIEASQIFDEDYGTVSVNIAPVKKNEEEIEFRARFHNISDRKAEAEVTIFEGNGGDLSRESFHVEIKEPFRESRGRFSVSPGSPDTVILTSTIEDAKGPRKQEDLFRIGVCPKIVAMSEISGFVSSDREGLNLTRDPRSFLKGPVSRPYDISVFPAYTNDAFLLRTVVSDGGKGSAHAVSRYVLGFMLDVRPREGLLPLGFHEGMALCQVAGTVGEKPSINVQRGKVENENLQTSQSRTDNGMEIQITVPWEVLGQVRKEKGAPIGFEFALELWNEGDEKVFESAWSGRDRVNRFGTAGTLFFED